MIFIDADSLDGTWQEFERLICRYLAYRNFDGARIVGTSGDKGADILAHKGGKRWLFQIKHWKRRVGVAEIEKTVQAMSFYKADIPAVVCSGGFDESAMQSRDRYYRQGVFCQLWDAGYLARYAEKIEPSAYPPQTTNIPQTRHYQKLAIDRLIHEFQSPHNNKAMIVMATGLGKTRIICEVARRILTDDGRVSPKIMVLAHTNDLVYQLERAFWHHLQARHRTAIWNGYEKQSITSLERADCVFACLNTAAMHVKAGGVLPEFDAVFVDECHHVGDEGMYANILREIGAGERSGAFLTGVTATPWRPDEFDLGRVFGEPLVSMDLVAGLKNGFLSEVDYRMYTTNLDWSKFGNKITKNKKLSPKGINRTLFISEWDDGVIDEFEKVFREQNNSRALVFCGTVHHAQMMRDKINALRICRAEAIFSSSGGREKQAIYERNRIISDFQIGKVQVVCCVDIFNEGIDVPDVNIVVFQRVTHSRRVFVQQLGRGLRLSPGKQGVIVMDFVSDVRRFAAGLDLKSAIQGMPVKLNHKVEFYRHGGKDERAESFLREWLQDMAAVQEIGENSAELSYPPVPQ